MSEKAKAPKAARKPVKKAPVVPDIAPPEPAIYADGRPFDPVQYLEAKLILKPDHFTSVEDFRKFGKLVKKTAQTVGVGFTEAEGFRGSPEIREILFVDTEDFALYRGAHILRRRIAYENGFPVGDPEVVFKFRHPDERKATELDVRPKIPGKYRIKFKAEVLPLKDGVGGYRVLYSHNCQFGISQVGDGDRTSMANLAKVFPALAKLGHSGEHVSLVNNGIVEEILLPIGVLDFGKGLLAKCDISLWRTRGEHKPLVGEFAFQAKFANKEAIAIKQRQRAAAFYMALQTTVADWLALGVTKTAMVYRLNGADPQSHE